MWLEALESMIRGADNEREYAHERLLDWARDAIRVLGVCGAAVAIGLIVLCSMRVSQQHVL